MSQWRLSIQPQAERDMRAIGEHLEKAAGPTTARTWTIRFETAILSLTDNPYLGAESDLLGAGRRRLVIRPYLIVYRVIEPEVIRIIRVVDGRRDLPRLFRNVGD
jgi:plasmid stabilization system protein ParE